MTAGLPGEPAAGARRDIAAEIAALGPWFHNLRLPDGAETAPDHFLGRDFPAFKWRQIEPYLPARLDGWRVLDVGCNAGFYSFELARRGADVVAVDVDPRYLAQARWAARELGLESRVRIVEADVYQVGRWDESFDIVWFMGVFYHLRYPQLALDLLARQTGRIMVFQTLTMPGKTSWAGRSGDLSLHQREPLTDEGWPKMAFFEDGFAGDPTNWWAPNHAAVESMLRSCGLHVTARPGDEIYLCEPSANADGSRAQYAAQLHSVLNPLRLQPALRQRR